MFRLRFSLPLLCALALVAPAAAQDSAGPGAASEAAQSDESARSWRVTFSTGFEFDKGDFGLPIVSEIWMVPISLRLEVGAFALGVATSWLRVMGPGNILGREQVVGTDGVALPRPSGTDSGIGDVVISGSYLYLPRNPALPLIEATIQVKAPTADPDKLLGTGKTDVTLLLDMSKKFGRLTAYATGGYRFVGSPLVVNQPPTVFTQALNDIWLASLGGLVPLGERLNAGLAYDYRQSIVPGIRNAHELVPYLSLKLGAKVLFGPYGVVGLSNGSPDRGIGTQVSVRF